MGHKSRRVRLFLQEHFYLPKDQAKELVNAYSLLILEKEDIDIQATAFLIYGAADRDGFFAEEDSISDAS